MKRLFVSLLMSVVFTAVALLVPPLLTRSSAASSSDTQFGTDRLDWVADACVDSNGNRYILGNTYGAFVGTNAGGLDLFLVKQDSTGAEVWRVQFGSSSDDTGAGVDVDNSGNVYICGYTDEALFGNSNIGGTDSFLVKIDAITGASVWDVQIATPEQDCIKDVEVVGQSLFIGGCSAGHLYGSRMDPEPLTDAVYAKYSLGGSLIWGKRLGCGKDSSVERMSSDSQGSLYIVGNLGSSFFTDYIGGAADAFAAKFDDSGNLIWGRQFGTDDNDYAHAVAVAADGSVYITSTIAGNRFMEPTPCELRKINASGADEWTRTLFSYSDGFTIDEESTDPPPSGDHGNDVAIDSSGNIYVCGVTDGNLFTTLQGPVDGFLVKYSSSGDPLWTYQLGTDTGDACNRVECNSDGSITTFGVTDGDMVDTCSGEDDVFIVTLSPVASPSFSPAGGTYSQSQTVTLTSTSGAAIRYTTDGTEPTEQSTLYTAPITVSQTKTIKARAWKEGFITSDTITATYVIQ